MADKSIEYTVHNYEAVNKYIDEQGRIRRTKSWVGYSKAISLFLVGLGVFLILAAYAYWFYKKPHIQNFINKDLQKQEITENKLNDKLSNKNNQIKKIENEMKKNPENEKLKNELEKLKKEKNELQKKLDNVVYKETVTVFKSKELEKFKIVTGFQWNTVDDLRFGKKHSKDWCYLEKSGFTLKYYFDHTADQSLNLNGLGITKSQAENYKVHCKNTL